jgi:hypothetical protein
MQQIMLIKNCLNEEFIKVHMDKYFFENFPIQNYLEKGNVLMPLLFSFSSEYAFEEVQENQKALKLRGTHQILVCADDINLLGDNIDTHYY